MPHYSVDTKQDQDTSYPLREESSIVVQNAFHPPPPPPSTLSTSPQYDSPQLKLDGKSSTEVSTLIS
jgi:hypothetical protein